MASTASGPDVALRAARFGPVLRLAAPALRLACRLPLLGPPLVRARLLRRHRRITGRTPRLDPPRGFNDHVLHRILHDRDPRLKLLNDKLAVRKMIADLAGPELVVPLLGVWTDPAEIDWAALPDRFVLKASHASGRFALVTGPAERDPAALMAKARHWLASDYFDSSLEWGYRGLPRRLLAEPLLRGPEGGELVEMQVLAFGGRAAFYRVQTGRKGGTAGRSDAWYEPDGTPSGIRINPRPCTVVPPRDAVAAAIAAAERLAAGFAHLRVDFYLTEAGLLIGELTPYHRAGATRWPREEWDLQLGALWTRAEREMHAR